MPGCEPCLHGLDDTNMTFVSLIEPFGSHPVLRPGSTPQLGTGKKSLLFFPMKWSEVQKPMFSIRLYTEHAQSVYG